MENVLEKLALINYFIVKITKEDNAWVPVELSQAVVDCAKAVGLILCGGAIDDDCSNVILYKS